MIHGKAAQESITLWTATALLPKNAPYESLANICIVQRDLCSNVEDNGPEGYEGNGSPSHGYNRCGTC